MDFDLTNENTEILRDPHNKYLINSDFNTGLPLYEEALKKISERFFFLNYHMGRLLGSKASGNASHENPIDKKHCGESNKNILKKAVFTLYKSKM